jgi:hypothetical protein
MFPKVKPKTWILGITLFAVTHGCDKSDTQIAREAADRQAQQNTEMAELNKEVASGTHQLVEADAQARKEIVGVHHDLQAERTRLDTGWSELEGERRQIAGERRTESMLVSVSSVIGGTALVVTLLGFCWYALVVSRRGEDTDAQLNELLVEDVLADQPTLLPNSSQHLLGITPATEQSHE